MSRRAAAHARRALAGGVPPLSWALAELERAGAPAGLAEEAWTAAGAAWAIADALARGRAVSGRAVVDVTFALHARLGLMRHGPATPHLELRALEPYMDWLGPRLAEGSPWRELAGRWVEIFNERLTLHRYAHPGHRRRQARDLVARPLALLAGAGAAPEELADRLLAYWDLRRAEADAAAGWNRVELPGGDSMGGFFGLSDQARPPGAERLRALAAELAERIAREPAPAPTPALAGWARALEERMAAELAEYGARGRWPADPAPAGGKTCGIRSWAGWLLRKKGSE